MYQYICQQCSKPFESKNSPGCKRAPKFCSHACYAKSKMGKVPWNKGQSMPNPPWNKGELVKFTCQICGKRFEVWPSYAKKRPPKYCSRKCAHEAKRRITGPEHPLWTCVERQCEWCGKSVWVKPAKLDEFRFCSRQCQGFSTAKDMAELNGPTSIEQLLMDELDRRHIPYHSQHQIAKWLVDITLPEHRIAIEADGDYWHSSPEQQEKDANKNHWLEAHGWTIHRFSGSEIRESPAACIDEVVASLGLPACQTTFLPHIRENG